MKRLRVATIVTAVTLLGVTTLTYLGASRAGHFAWAAQQQKPTTPPREFTNSIRMKFVRIDPGSFKMRCGGEGYIHDVTLTKGYYLQTTEVTQAQWQTVMGINPSYFKAPDRPVEMVTWNDAQEFLGKLNAKEKDTRYRLPTEAEWEYGYQAGGQTTDITPNPDEVGWMKGNSGEMTHPVGQKKPNAWGLYDMQGNVWEWVQDCFDPCYAKPQVDPQGPPSCNGSFPDLRVIRGGSWNEGTGAFWDAARERRGQGDRTDYIGFRCARTF